MEKDCVLCDTGTESLIEFMLALNTSPDKPIVQPKRMIVSLLFHQRDLPKAFVTATVRSTT
jgi:hypothetical protein